MKADRITRVNELIRRELGIQLYRVVNQPGFNPATVTFTRAETAVDLRTCRVGVSVIGDEEAKERTLALLRRYRGEFQAALRANVVLRYTPHLHFVLDRSVERGDRVLEILGKMEEAGEVPADAAGAAGAGETDLEERKEREHGERVE